MKYRVIYADPPWSYKDKALAGNRGAGCKYPVMDFESIARLPVASIAAPDSILFMWATFPKLDEALALFPRWGFTFKTNGFTWVKTNRKASTHFMGMGSWTRANAEVCLIGTRGQPKRVNAGVHSVVVSPIQEHSRKPAEVRERIVRLVGDVPRVELFARQAAPGWDRWGNQIDSTIEIAPAPTDAKEDAK